jgi:hypothetical protein
MRLSRFYVVALLVLGLTASTSAFAQSQTHKKVFGFQDPETGEFHAFNYHSGVVPDVTTTTPTVGQITINVTITLKTAVPTGFKVLCGANLSVTSVATNPVNINIYEEEANDYATVSGSTATCKVVIPYSWLLQASTTTDPVSNSLGGDLTVEIGDPTATTTVPQLVRLHSQPIPTGGKIPPAATTTYTMAATL